MAASTWNQRWAGAPRSARIIVDVGAVALLYGTIVHVVQIVAGRGDPYPSLPGWLALYFVSLTVLDPLAAALLLRGERSGLVLSGAILLSDAGANGYANYGLDPTTGLTVGRLGHAVVTVLAVTFTAAAVRIWNNSGPRSLPGHASGSTPG